LPFYEHLVANAALPQFFYFAFYFFLLLKAEFVEIEQFQLPERLMSLNLAHSKQSS
jgi:hypothetical protein